MIEIIDNLLNLKDQYLKNPKNIDLNNYLKSIFGKSFGDDEIKNLIQGDNNNFSNKIKEKFESKRNERVDILGKNQSEEIEKRIFLQTIDLNWKSHIQYLEQLRQVIGLRSYGQKDPLSEFKKEAFTLFEVLLEKIKNDVIKFLFNLNIVVSRENPDQEKPKETNFDNKKIGRNEKCPCGSEKKYKHCCGSV